MNGRSTIEQILDAARWAPSGDNSQPWRFEILSDRQVRICVRDEAAENVYDFDGQPTLLSTGFLLESMRIAASRFGLSVSWTCKRVDKHEHSIYVNLIQDASVVEDVLLPFLSTRSVDRRRYRITRLTQDQRTALEQALGEELEVRWFDSLVERSRIVGMNAMATHIRLSIRETYLVHRRVLDWQRDLSPDGIPANSIGLDRMTLSSMKWAMKTWGRVQFLNRFMAGTLVPRLEMDVVPGLFCAAHFMVFFRQQRDDADRSKSLISAGQGLQRFWLTATAHGLALQPSMAPLIFSYYAETNQAFTGDLDIRVMAQRLMARLSKICARKNGDAPLFLGRVGNALATAKKARSIRQALPDLLVK